MFAHILIKSTTITYEFHGYINFVIKDSGKNSMSLLSFQIQTSKTYVLSDIFAHLQLIELPTQDGMYKYCAVSAH